VWWRRRKLWLQWLWQQQWL